MTEETKEKKHVCTVCGKPSPTVFCHACEEKLRAEALEKKRGTEKAGKTDTGRK